MKKLFRFFGSPAGLAVLVIVAAITCASIAATYLFKLIQTDVEDRLVATLEASIHQARQSLEKHQTLARYWAENPLIQAAALAASNQQSSDSKTQISNAQASLSAVSGIENYRDYRLIDRHGNVILSRPGHDVRRQARIRLPDNLLSQAWHGRTVVTPPFKSGRPWPDKRGRLTENIATMMILSPVRDEHGRTVALLSFELDPDLIFLPAFHHNQIGKTGHTYAINSDGLLLTASKYDQQLRNSGLLNPRQPHAALNLVVNDPKWADTDAQNALTEMAVSLSQGQSGINLQGYRDYRGVDVIGAWRWDNSLGMGVVTETEAAEVYQLYRSILLSVTISIVFVIAITLIALFFYRRKHQHQMSSLHQRDAIINQTDDGFVTIDNRGMIVMTNPAITRLFGYASDELIGNNVSILLPPDERVEHDHYVRHSEIHERKIIHKVRSLQGCHKDGHLFPIELNVTPMTFSHQKYFIGVIRDISERHSYQQALIAAKEAAEEANQAKSDFLAKMSHELRTPLNAIIGFSQLLKMDKLDANQRESVEMIHDAGEHLLALINDVLDLARIESGRMLLSLEAVSPQELLGSLYPMLNVQIQTLGLSFTTEIDVADDCHVYADYTKLKQVLLNLLSNACKYNRPGGTITLRVTTQPDGKVRISVQDSGDGISEKMQKRIFEPFNRLDKTNSKIEGTGIGLAISAELVKLMGGELGFSSRLGEGSTFWVMLSACQPSGHQTDSD
ncbi:multi-sensor hybrid histidine kinase [Methylophaga lonarensis MPL]|uniref:Sensor protein FixL n=1 Tax=Methylophaga lonarensis MPL TaxID=1286106 RepID=M7PH03_9GAMM|nr:ATP-binding protein [Methylophaga lonarensis]EMR13180.1 multi-sensor hybrid histidine kinase [Methylophaga lonarensis MPL]